ncbi:MAG: hypothetical protein QM743_08410 [Chitinophagaceae bacterium]
MSTNNKRFTTDLTQDRYKITAEGPISDIFRNRGLNDLHTAAAFIRQLPYGRNPDKHRPETIFTDGCATCSTKHAILKNLALEHDWDEIGLFIGIFRMNGTNTPKVKEVLDANRLQHIPEAHCYLKINGEILDITTVQSGPEQFVPDLMEELEILPSQITDFKIAYHKAILRIWLESNPEHALSLDQIWSVREQCIRSLSI